MQNPPRKRDAEQTRKRIIEAAEKVFVKKGFDGARVDEIAREAGANKRLLYLYYGNKDDLYFEVLRINFRRMIDAERASVEPGADPEAHVIAIIRHFFRTLAQNTGLARLLAWASLADGRSDARYQQSVDLLREGLGDLLSAVELGKTKGQFRGDVDVRRVAFLLTSACLSYFHKRMLMDALWGTRIESPGDAEKSIDEMIEVVMRGIRSGGRALEHAS
ncbi:MAG: TetR/AcrR family transcriptional regulator [Deltaproteobacteria bacterium]|nr:TetR/AcrR family transcriptional regulator [Deltaproteobacteria bacterium]